MNLLVKVLLSSLVTTSLAHGAAICKNDSASVTIEDASGMITVSGLENEGVEDGRYSCYHMQMQNMGWIQGSALACSNVKSSSKMQAYLTESVTFFGRSANVAIYRFGGEKVFQENCQKK